MLIEITKRELNELRIKAENSSRGRINFNFHNDPGDRLHRMLNAMQGKTYVQPHKHENPDKREVFLLLTGRAAVLEFDDQGAIISSIILDRDYGNYGVEIPARVWHTVLSLDDNTVVYEVKDGPYSPSDDKYFAPWAPGEHDPGAGLYLKKLKELLR